MAKYNSKNTPNVNKNNVHNIRENTNKKKIDKALLYFAFGFSLVALLRSFQIM